MKVVVQRVKKGSVSVNGNVINTIGKGYILLVGMGLGDSKEEIDFIANKIAYLRIFEDEDDKMNRSILDVGGEILAISQFTLFADCKRGRRPSFIEAAPPQEASQLFDYFVEQLRTYNITVKTGIFQAMMDVELCNYGPVTIVLDSKEIWKNK